MSLSRPEIETIRYDYVIGHVMLVIACVTLEAKLVIQEDTKDWSYVYVA